MSPIPVSLTFDDALDAHLDCAIPRLDARGMKGTFYVNLNAPSFGSRSTEWQLAAATGHELGNHTVAHPSVPSKAWVSRANNIERYTLDRMRQELEAANAALQALDGRTERSFAYPCSYPFVGAPGIFTRTLRRLSLDRTRLMGWVNHTGIDPFSRRADYTPVVSGLFPAARCGGLGPPPWGPISRFRVAAFAADGSDSPALEDYLAECRRAGRWAVILFHGVGGGHSLSCDLDVFDRLLAHLADAGAYRVRTFVAAARDQWPAGAKEAAP